MLAVSAVFLVAGCSATAERASPGWTFSPGAGEAVPPATAPVAGTRTVELHRSPACSCCHGWEAYMRAAGWTITVVDEPDLDAFRASVGVARDAASCHTAIIDGYAVEGHVPIEAIEDLLAARPAIDGIALPGMPAGSPGMPGPKAAPFEVVTVSDGAIGPFGSY